MDSKSSNVFKCNKEDYLSWTRDLYVPVKAKPHAHHAHVAGEFPDTPSLSSSCDLHVVCGDACMVREALLLNLARRPRDRICVQFVPLDLPQQVAWTARGT